MHWKMKKMNKMELKFCGDPVLRQSALPVESVTPDVLNDLDQMARLMRVEDGVGLAAPQVGILKRFLVLFNPETEQIMKIINPQIVSHSDQEVLMEEGCLSIQSDKGPIFAEVSRPESVMVQWIDELSNKQQAEFSGILSRIIQHEIDHLDGKLFIDYLSSAKREMVMNKVKKRKQTLAV